jgi:hypothetical protein
MSYIKFLEDITKDLKEKEIIEMIYREDFFKELEQKLMLTEKLSPEERERIAHQLATPSAMPYDFDVTLEAWLHRISFWGKIKITRHDPEGNIRRTLTQDEFLSYTDNQSINSQRGLLQAEELDINKIRFSRKFWAVMGKEVTEEIIVEIDLRDAIKDALKKARKELGWFGH